MIRETGNYEIFGKLYYFVPYSLPPKNPSLTMDSKLIQLYGKAMHCLGQLNEMAQRLPNIERFIKAYAIKEAIKSSEIEGIHTTVSEIFTQPLPGRKTKKNTQLVLNYMKAMNEALEKVLKEGYPIVGRILLASHAKLLGGGEGDKSAPGKYRQQFVRVGDLLPPPAPKIMELMSDLEKYMNEDQSLPPLIKAGLIHVQFETIHPFLDGNGRIGRLLIVLILMKEGILSAPILYPSCYFKRYHTGYYHHLNQVRVQGDFEGWVSFFLEGMIYAATDAWKRAKAIETLEKETLQKIKSSELTQIRKKTLLDLVPLLFQYPILNATGLATETKKSFNASAAVIEDLASLGILALEKEQKRNRLYAFSAYLDILNQD